ncbi:hypothetical protein [Desulfonatronum thioautotrophicum]|uniref:hypothetical protein n=1 Tax=Desulfonatronum thioautotrophicum TaxID=617001 RepID=UPI0005EBB2E3|nr:hypothetical protein [Desulfonatronum thioautotrophicum]
MQTQMNGNAGEGRRKQVMDRRKQTDRRSGLDRRLEGERRPHWDHGALHVNDAESSQKKGFKHDAAEERRVNNDRRGTYQARGLASHVVTDNEIRFLLGSA